MRLPFECPVDGLRVEAARCPQNFWDCRHPCCAAVPWAQPCSPEMCLTPCLTPGLLPCGGSISQPPALTSPCAGSAAIYFAK